MSEIYDLDALHAVHHTDLKCSNCAKWLVAKTTSYDDGSIVDNYRAPEGMGHCSDFDKDMKADFFCGGFVEGTEADHVVTAHKVGEPWQHHHWGPCPDCKGEGGWTVLEPGQPGRGSACGRCCQTGRVLYYDDGYIGEEKTRLHPKEKEAAEKAKAHMLATGQTIKKKCAHCHREGEYEWNACPWCGISYYEPPAKTEVVSGLETLQ